MVLRPEHVIETRMVRGVVKRNLTKEAAGWERTQRKGWEVKERGERCDEQETELKG